MKNSFTIITLAFSVIMVIAVTALACGLLFTDMMMNELYGNKRIAFICILLAYALYRGFRMYQLLKYRKTEDVQ